MQFRLLGILDVSVVFLSGQTTQGKPLGEDSQSFPRYSVAAIPQVRFSDKGRVVALFFKAFFFFLQRVLSGRTVHVGSSGFSAGSKGPCWWDAKTSRKRALLKGFSEHPWRTKPLSSSLRVFLYSLQLLALDFQRSCFSICRHRWG